MPAVSRVVTMMTDEEVNQAARAGATMSKHRTRGHYFFAGQYSEGVAHRRARAQYLAAADGPARRITARNRAANRELPRWCKLTVKRKRLRREARMHAAAVRDDVTHGGVAFVGGAQ